MPSNYLDHVVAPIAYICISTMKDRRADNVVIIGSGNVASHLYKAFLQAGHPVIQLLSRSGSLKSKIQIDPGTEVITDTGKISSQADYYLMCVSDRSIIDISEALNVAKGIVVHTSGTTSMNVFEGNFANYGVFYPLQTFSADRSLDMSEVPFLIEGNNIKTEDKLLSFARSISNNVQVMSSEKRLTAHLAAVIACNFSNHMYDIAAETLNSAGLSFDLIRPLIMETAWKVMDAPPGEAQTGPAYRHDQQIINSHLEKLESDPEYKKIYEAVSKSILRLKKERQ